MSSRNVSVALYYGGKMVREPNGVSYNTYPKKIILVGNKISLDEMVRLTSLKLRLGKNVEAVELICRYPMSTTKTGIRYAAIRMDDDEDLHQALEIPVYFPAQLVVEMYVTVRVNSSFPTSGAVRPGGFTQILTGSAPDIAGHPEYASAQTSSSDQFDCTAETSTVGGDPQVSVVYDVWDESYNELPRFMSALQQSNPGTVVLWKHDPGSNSFGSMFWVFKPSVDGFRYCRPLVFVDRTFLQTKYNEKLLFAMGMDAASHIFPLAFSIVKEESQENWVWFLTSVRCYVLGNLPNVCLVSDHALDLLAAIKTDATWQPPYVHHRFCLRQLRANFFNEFSSEVLCNQLNLVFTEHKVHKFWERMNKIKELNENAYNWLMAFPLEKWTLSHDGGRRYYANPVALYRYFKDVEHIPITACVKKIFHKMKALFNKFQQEAQAHLRNGDLWPTSVHQHYLNNERYAKKHCIKGFDRHQEAYEVVTDYQNGVAHSVLFNKRTCTCGEFQLNHMPCSQTIKVCQFTHRVAADFVAPFYTSQAMLQTYSSTFAPLPGS